MTSDGEIAWAKVLRIVRQQWLPESNRERDLYRVVYLGAENDLRIRKNVEFKPNQKFAFARCAPLGAASRQSRRRPMVPPPHRSAFIR